MVFSSFSLVQRSCRKSRFVVDTGLWVSGSAWGVFGYQLNQFNQSHCCLLEKYDYVGRLLKPGDEPSEYTDEEDIKDHLKND